mgnify:FL=1
MLRCTRAPLGTFMKVFFRILSGVVHYQWDARRLWNIRAMILFPGSDSETVALNLFRSNMASKAQNYLQLSSSLVVVSDDLLLCLLKPGEKIAYFAFYPFPRTWRRVSSCWQIGHVRFRTQVTWKEYPQPFKTHQFESSCFWQVGRAQSLSGSGSSSSKGERWNPRGRTIFDLHIFSKKKGNIRSCFSSSIEFAE